MKANRWSFIRAHAFVKERRPEVSTKFEEQLKIWEQIEYDWNGTSELHQRYQQMYKGSKFNRKAT